MYNVYISPRTILHLSTFQTLNKGHKTAHVMGSYTAEKDGMHDGLPVAEVEGHRDEDDMAVFGKRQQLKVRFRRGHEFPGADIQ